MYVKDVKMMHLKSELFEHYAWEPLRWLSYIWSYDMSTI